MPNDTLWLGNKGGKFVLFDSNGKLGEENWRIIQEDYRNNPDNYPDNTNSSRNEHKTFDQKQFDKDVAFYDKVGFEINFILLGLFCYAIYYAIKRYIRKKRNPLGEDESDWVELGSREETNTFNN